MKTNSCPLRSLALHQSLRRRPASAFTLIELLVVIAIIGVLAGIAVPIMQTAMLTAQQNRALQHARQIGLGLRMFGADHDGRFPSGTNLYDELIRTSNDELRPPHFVVPLWKQCMSSWASAS